MTVTGLAFSSPESSTPFTHAYFVSAYILGFPCQNLRKKKQSQLLKLNYKAEDVAHLVQGMDSNVALRLACCYIPVVPALGKWRQKDQKFQNSVGYIRT